MELLRAVALVAAARLEATWVRWNTVRTALTGLALGCLAWALVEYGRL